MSQPPQKSPDAFRTIGEAAAEIGVPHHVLRFWETRFPQLQPMKRGGNRRYYRPADMALLRTIHTMLHDRGLTIRGAQKALAEGEVASPPSFRRRPEPMNTAANSDATSGSSGTANPEFMGSGLRRNDGENSFPPAFDISRLRAVRDRLAAALAA